MNTNQALLHTKTRTVAAVSITIIIILISSIGPALAQGTNGLLGVIRDFPQVDSSGVTGQTCSYNATTMTLTIETTPALYFPNVNTLNFINDGINNRLLTLTAIVDQDGNVSSLDRC